MICTSHQIFCYSGDQIKNNALGGACGFGEPGEVYTEFWWGNLRERNNFEDIGIDGRLILKWAFKK
jgi:hypothetical protein